MENKSGRGAQTSTASPVVTLQEGSRYDIPDNPAWSLYQGAVNQLQCIDDAITHCDFLLTRRFGRPLTDVRRQRTQQERESLVNLRRGVESEMADAFDQSSLDHSIGRRECNPHRMIPSCLTRDSGSVHHGTIV
ncbi:MAG: hypothetical protein RB191_01680 [Terriglobia bacterium]|nr:hypothetical protein [Terriglobia bacterium]